MYKLILLILGLIIKIQSRVDCDNLVACLDG